MLPIQSSVSPSRAPCTYPISATNVSCSLVDARGWWWWSIGQALGGTSRNKGICERCSVLWMRLLPPINLFTTAIWMQRHKCALQEVRHFPEHLINCTSVSSSSNKAHLFAHHTGVFAVDARRYCFVAIWHRRAQTQIHAHFQVRG